MSPAARSRYTLLIPTYNRSAYLRGLLGYLAARRFEHPIRILDSSSGQALSENRDNVARTGLDVDYQIFDPAIPVNSKVALGIESVATPYCSFCADDDVLFTRNLDQLLDVLDADPAFVAAHGYYVNFKPGHDFYVSNTVYSAPSIAGDDGLKRIVDQMGDYQAIFYAIHRTDVMRSVLKQAERVPSLFAQELVSSSLTLIAGGVYRAQEFFMARNTNPSIASDGWSPHHFLATNPEQLLREYAAYRAVVLEQLATDPRCAAAYEPEQLRRAFDVVHLKYLAPMLSPRVLDYIIAESLRPGRQPRDIIAGMWNGSASPSERQAGGMRRALTHLGRAFMRPRYALELGEYALRFVSLASALRVRQHLRASVSPRLDNMYVDGTARDGRPRRYLLARQFVSQELRDRQRITASHIADIIEHLDDYV